MAIVCGLARVRGWQLSEQPTLWSVHETDGNSAMRNGSARTKARRALNGKPPLKEGPIVDAERWVEREERARFIPSLAMTLRSLKDFTDSESKRLRKQRMHQEMG